MLAIGLGVAWAGYTIGLWGWCLIQGYNVPFTGLFGPAWPAVTGGTSTVTPGVNPQVPTQAVV